jgi:hypothetical protein
MRELLEETVSIGFNAKSVSTNMDTPQLVEKLNGYGITLCVRDSKLICDSENPIPKGIALTISAHEQKLISYLASNKDDFRANETKSHDLTEQSRFENEGVGNADDLTSGEASALVQESCKNSEVPDQAQSSPTPLLNKGGEKPADKHTYHPGIETTSGGSEDVTTNDTLIDEREPGQKVCETYGTLPVNLPPILLHNLMLWVAQYHELRLEHPNGVILNAQPEHVIEASEAYPWGVVYDSERYLLLSWGDVPKVTLLGLRDLETGELLIPEPVAA